MALLSESLQLELATVVLGSVLATFPLFAESPREVVGKLCRLAETVQGAGADVFAEEDARATCMCPLVCILERGNRHNTTQ